MLNINEDKHFDKNSEHDEQQAQDSLTGKKVDADLEEESDQPDESSQVTQASQKGKKVDADPKTETPSRE